jgi:NADPH-dependent glutamate synthase beta subunit-like oxidoreductase
MATSRDDKKLTFRKFEDGDYKWDKWTDAIFEGDHSHKCPTYVHRTPPCQGSCPSGEDIRGWLDIVRGIEKPPQDITMQEYAFRRSTDANPFPAMMGRVCPAPCQDGCNRNDVEDFVGINAVEQYIGDAAFTQGFKFEPAPALIGKKVAIIGGGPAGLAAAYQLRRRGIASTIFEMHPELGGMMRYGIPNYRIPRAELDREIDRILEMGDIEVKTGTRVGQDVSVEQLEKDYDAILWSNGCWIGRGLPLEGWEETPNCVSAVKFLERFNKGEMKYTASKIVCVGGGDTSIDVVSVSRRIGTLKNFNENPEDVVEGRISHKDADVSQRVPCANVTLTALFPRNQMTAAEHEVNDALHEGVVIINEVMPVEIIRDAAGRATALKLVDCKWENNGPVAVEGGKEYVIEADMIVSAIGQGGDMAGLEDYANERSLIDGDKFYQVPNRPGHFAAGDIIRPHLLTTAIGQASIAAESIEHYVKNESQRKRPKVDKHHFSLLDKMKEAGLEPEAYTQGETRGTNFEKFAVHNYEDRSKNEVISSEKLFLGHFSYTPRNLREEDVPSADEVLNHFAERTVGFTDEQAVAEAERCMSCGMCFECDNCVIYCPQDAVFRVKKDEATTGRYVDTDYAKCVGCHICADVCPTGYIDMALGE